MPEDNGTVRVCFTVDKEAVVPIQFLLTFDDTGFSSAVGSLCNTLCFSCTLVATGMWFQRHTRKSSAFNEKKSLATNPKYIIILIRN